MGRTSHPQILSLEVVPFKGGRSAKAAMNEAVTLNVAKVSQASLAYLDLCLRAMCLVASVDGQLKATEVEQIVACMRSRGADASEVEMRQRVISACKDIASKGASESAKDLVQSLQAAVKGKTAREFVLSVMKDVASSDGRAGAREGKVLDYFTQHLGLA